MANKSGADEPGTDEPAERIEAGEPDSTASSPLEAGYRRWLRLLPAPYRAVREQEMVEALLHSRVEADPELADATLQGSWPGLREVASVVALALRLRWAAPDGPRRYAETTAALRAATLTGLTVMAVMAVVSVLGTVLLAVSPPSGARITVDVLLFGGTPGVWSLLRTWAYLLWIPALVLALLGGRRRTAWAAALTLIPVVISALGTILSPAGPAMLGDWLWVVVRLAVVAGLVAMATVPPEPVHRTGASDAAEARLRVRLLAVGIVLLSWTFVVVAVSRWAPNPTNLLPYAAIVDLSGVWCLATLVVAVTLTGQGALRRSADPAGLLGLAYVAGAAVVLRLAGLPTWISYAGHGGQGAGPILVSAFVQLAVAVIICCGAGGLGVRGLHRLPPVSYLPARR